MTAARCRHCGVSIRLVPTARNWAWVHVGPGGGFPCRDAASGMWQPTFAEPPDAVAPSGPPMPGTTGRHRAA